MSDPVMSTNDDASCCKRYAVHQGYWQDNYIQYFVKTIPDRKAPEINRGYYIRHRSMRKVIVDFLNLCDKKCQIVSLGAGFDTLFWNLHKDNMVPEYSLYEVDLKLVVQKKCNMIRSKSPLKSCLSDVNIDIENARLTSDKYQLLSADITNVDDLLSRLREAGLQNEHHTMFVAECVFVYLSPEYTQTLLNAAASEFNSVVFLEYDPVNLNDRFGQVMKHNLRERQCYLLGAQPDLQSKLELYRKYSSVSAKLLYDLYLDLPQQEKQQIEKIEFFDEIDLLFDLLKHYSICIAYNDSLSVGFGKLFL